MSVVALIPAAGCGRRFGPGVRKQFLHLGGRPVVVRTLEIFQNHPLIDKIFLIVPADETDCCRQEIVAGYGLAKIAGVVSGGEERQDSVANGLFACGSEADDIVVIHDGVRPMFPAEKLGQVILMARQNGACIVGVPVKDTLKEVAGGVICGTPDRSRLWQAQTPQAFRYDIIRRAYEAALEGGVRATDDAALVERLGVKVRMIEGSYRNIKITTPEDLLLAEAFLAAAGELGP
ncbi:MAG: 2-C-methyl-D-erythritol 4-phosphate cytidylyltransferase [Desulfuromonadaceae bacterium]|nr:2-C-methyl-D-erythritol 4-phosphate cytidylyltransferase [Desulfuromonadaceae bacterium]